MDYYVSFNGLMCERTRPEGFPKVIRDKFVFRADNPMELVNYLNTRAKEIQSRGGMNIVFDVDENESVRNLIKQTCPDEVASDPAFGNGYFIPLHMIAFITYTVRRLSGEVPPDDIEKGKVN